MGGTSDGQVCSQVNRRSCPLEDLLPHVGDQRCDEGGGAHPCSVTSSCPAAERQPVKPSHRDIQVHAAVSAGVLQPRIYA